MKKITLVISSFILMINLGCTERNQTDEQKLPNESMFEVQIDEITDVHVNQNFKITGFLKNKSKDSWQILDDDFTCEIFDGKGNLVPQGAPVAVGGVGTSTLLKPNEIIRYIGKDPTSRVNKFAIRKPGHYTVRAKTKFWYHFDSEAKQFIISSKPVEFIVK